MTVKEFIDIIDKRNFYHLDFVEDIEGDFEQVACRIDLDEHRWYSIATDVYKLEDGFVGVRGLYQIFNEMNIPTDFDIVCYAFEMEEAPTVTYKRKKMTTEEKLQSLIIEYKKHDKQRNDYYANKMKRLGELEAFVQELEDVNNLNSIVETIKKLKAHNKVQKKK